MTDAGYEIKLDLFQGPFDLLLFFIERDELNIHDIPISQITDEFLRYIQQLQSLNMEVASEFIFVASTLMRIKSKMLLPRPIDSDGEDGSDLREDLIQKLVLYKQFKEACEDLRVLEYQRSLVFQRGNIQSDIHAVNSSGEQEDDLKTLDLYELMMTYERVRLNPIKRPEEIKHTIVQYPYTIEQQKSAIAKLIAINEQLDFAAIAKQAENKVHFVYQFLAILEMLQQDLLAIEIGLGYNSFTVRRNG